MTGHHHTNLDPKCSISSRQFAIDISNTEQKSRGLKTHPCRTPPCMAKDLLQPLLPTTCPCWSRYKFWIIQIMCSGRPCFERASHSAGQCTRSKAFDKSRLTTQIGTSVLESLSKSKRVVTKCSSHACHPENHVVLLADGFQVEFPPVPKSCRQKVCKTVVWLQSGGILKEPQHAPDGIPSCTNTLHWMSLP